MVRSSDLPLLRWHGGGDHRGTEQSKIAIDAILTKRQVGMGMPPNGWGGWSEANNCFQ